ncbi:hypothetical protein ACFSCV_03635 [Methylopila henanensis]|uniref:Alpha/beta hydrolase n=1 Tax=Methylopila henanensis TaxID=873516 RepID=A0ABW4K677_9HYPH
MVERIEIFSGRDVAVVGALHGGGGDVVITFTPHADGPRQPGYADKLLDKHGVSAIHFIHRDTHWWQTPEMAAAIAAVGALDLPRRFASVVTYGSSMGGHGALLFAKALKADRTLAISPQFAVGGRNAGWKKQWKVSPELYRYEDVRSETARTTILFDPRYPFDRAHAEAFMAVAPVETVHVPFAAHDVSAALAEMGLLSGFVLDFVAGRDDPDALRHAIRARRRDSLVCLNGLLHQLERRSQKGRMLAGVREQTVRLFLSYLENGRKMHLKRVMQSVVSPHLEHLAARGERARGVAIAEQLCDIYPKSLDIAALLSNQLAADGRMGDAYQALFRCFRRNKSSGPCALAACAAALQAGLEPEAQRLLAKALELPRQDANSWLRFLRAWHDRIPHGLAVRGYNIAAALEPEHKNLKRVGALIKASNGRPWRLFGLRR